MEHFYVLRFLVRIVWIFELFLMKIKGVYYCDCMFWGSLVSKIVSNWKRLHKNIILKRYASKQKTTYFI